MYSILGILLFNFASILCVELFKAFELLFLRENFVFDLTELTMGFLVNSLFYSILYKNKEI